MKPLSRQWCAFRFDHPDWHNGFEHDPEEAARVRIRLLHELAETGEQLVATHLPFPSVGRVAVDGEEFRWVPVIWDYCPRERIRGHAAWIVSLADPSANWITGQVIAVDGGLSVS